MADVPDTARPYLVIPKLIEQPTWGGDYIIAAKKWQTHPLLGHHKIGQSYELFSGSNLSLYESSDDPNFVGELTDRDAAQFPSNVPNSVPLAALVAYDAEATLGATVVAGRGPHINLLIKFTQALGNSFQIHLKDDETHPHWVSKPESWYFFEPGLLTLGVKLDTDWLAYEAAVTAVQEYMQSLSSKVERGQLTYEAARPEIDAMLKKYDPWQYVNFVETAKDDLVDLSCGALHHSWEEDAERLPLGNVLYELQTEAMDDVSTIRCFDRGKMTPNGSVRDVHIKDYFELIDRTVATNDPKTHTLQPQPVASTEAYDFMLLLKTKYYTLHRLTFKQTDAIYEEQIQEFRHVFVKSGAINVTAGAKTLKVTAGHACFIPAGAQQYTLSALESNADVLLSQ